MALAEENGSGIKALSEVALQEEKRRPALRLFWLGGIADETIRNTQLAETVQQDPGTYCAAVSSALRHGLTFGYKPDHRSVKAAVDAVLASSVLQAQQVEDLTAAWRQAQRGVAEPDDA